MSTFDCPVPHLTTVSSGPLQPLEEVILNQVPQIEAWFRQCWQKTPPPITSSVDLRNASFKLSPVDTNLFPAGYNNLNPAFLPLCVQAAQSVLADNFPKCTRILIVPESHTRNKFYLESLARLQEIFVKAGFLVKIGSIDSSLTKERAFILESGESLIIEPLMKANERIQLSDFSPCLLLLNNDLSSGIPDSLMNLKQEVQPPLALGWGSRLKSSHFNFFNAVVDEFAAHIGIDPWVINPMFKQVNNVDFMAQEGIDVLADSVESLLEEIAQKYKVLGINEKPFVVIKADNGTYGMAVMMVNDKSQVLTINRKQRTKMAASKGSRQVSKVIVQEGIPSYESMEDGSVAEPVVYMIGPFVVGGFYRVHKGRGRHENLNAPGMHFEPLAFANACNVPGEMYPANRFYVYGVVARLAALAAAREIAAIGG